MMRATRRHTLNLYEACMANGKPRIAFIGFGEAGQAIAAGLHDADAAVMAAWDILFPQGAGNKLQRAADASGVHCAASAADAVRQAELVISAVTAASSGEAAESVKAHLRGDPFFLDINSVSPGRKQDTAKMLGSAARYVDVAVLAPIHPARHQTPMLIAGRTAKPSRRRLLASACAQALPAPRLARRQRSRWCAA
jgi:3-hydroxyisobutyrate dehydrogenase-like beta-hydroxyacid dehydrogenase